ncbi:MAG: ATP-binding protein [Armatimonadetes bacterium]|nr:ATP-binding protein [Armatimonadota bacterium]
MTTTLLTEIERQQKYLDRLPEEFAFPLFNARHALESQRKSGYRNSASASREIVDNAIDAGAERIHVIFDTDKGPGQKKIVTAIAFIDDGSGMLPRMARYALTWGGGTHFDEPGQISKFGFGLPNASINQTRLVEAFTRTEGEESFWKATLDLSKFTEYGLQTVDEPVKANLPEFVQSYVDRTGFDLSHGTVVVWWNPDRLTYKAPGMLKEHLVDDFGVVYRYMLARTERPLELMVEGVQVVPADPLFLMPESRLYLPESEGGAKRISEQAIAVRYWSDPLTGERHLKAIEDESELEDSDPNTLAIGTIYVTIARFPVGFVQGARKKGDAADAYRRFEIRKSRRGISFVRTGREIETYDAFPKTTGEESRGMGDWPLLQSYAYHWAIEMKFDSSLDDVFGITNDKQSVRPIEDFWRVLAAKDIDDLLRSENRWQEEQRDKSKPKAEPSSTPSPAERAAAEADVASGTKPKVPEHGMKEANENLELEAEKRVGVSAASVEEARAAIHREAARRPYLIDYIELEDGPFYKPVRMDTQIVVKVNRSHPFYQALYGELLALPGGTKAKEAVDVLLIALSKAELTADEELGVIYETQRKQKWSPFLATAMKRLSQSLRPSEEAMVESEAFSEE